MHPDWQKVDRVLLVSLLDRDSALVLQQILPLIQQSLPQCEITLLAPFLELLAGGSLDGLPANQVSTLSEFSLSFPFSDLANHAADLMQALKARSFDAAIVFTLPHQSPFLIAYCCYLASIPIRVGQSCEFGGGVLSHCVRSPIDPADVLNYQLYLLRSVGLAIDEFLPATRSSDMAIV